MLYLLVYVVFVMVVFISDCVKFGVVVFIFLIGVVIFVGMFYVMVFGVLCWFGVVMLIGGVGLFIGWGLMVWMVLKV